MRRKSIAEIHGDGTGAEAVESGTVVMEALSVLDGGFGMEVARYGWVESGAHATANTVRQPRPLAHQQRDVFRQQSALQGSLTPSAYDNYV